MIPSRPSPTDRIAPRTARARNRERRRRAAGGRRARFLALAVATLLFATDGVAEERSMILANFAINLEHVGDIVAKNLLKLVGELRDKHLSFSEEGWRELTDQHDLVMQNIQLALNVLVSADVAACFLFAAATLGRRRA